MTKVKNMKVREIEDYIHVYRMHLQNNDLEDDSLFITIGDLIDYVNDQIDLEDKKWYGLV